MRLSVTMHTFFAPPDAFQSHTRVILPEKEAQHAVLVLRQKQGTEVIVVDGAGGWYRVCLDQINRHQVIGRILEVRRETGEPSYHLRLGIALLKNKNRFEIFLEKAVELGISEILPLHTQRTQPYRFNIQRAQKILIAAIKQCGRSRLPELRKPVSFEEVLDTHDLDAAFIAHEKVTVTNSLHAALESMKSTARLCVLIGPEGGFTASEVQLAQKKNFVPVSLGPRRLRTETAALVATSNVMSHLS